MLKRLPSIVYAVQKRKSRCLAGSHSVLSRNSSTDVPQVPAEADAVVIGGGSLGCNTIYHLTKLGINNAVLLESNELTSGTTWHAAGLLVQRSMNETDAQLLTYSRHLFKSLEEETGVSTGWIENGGVYTASNKVRLEEYKRMNTFSKAVGIESHLLTPEETKKVYPLMNVSDLYGALCYPGEGTVEPAGVCTALTRAAKAAGAKVIEKCPVTNISTKESWLRSRQVTEVHTPYGSIKTPIVISCTGGWSSHIGKMLNFTEPLVVLPHAYVVTEHIEGLKGMPNCRDLDRSVYLRVNGDYLCVGGFEPHPTFLEEELSQSFAFSLYDLDWDVFSYLLEGAMNRIPVLEKTGIKSTVCGPESFTPDHKPIMGEDLNVRGFYHCYGFNSGGLMYGPGCGREIARWAVHGRPSLDMHSYDIRRFHPEISGKRQWIKERSHESFMKHYGIVFPNDEPMAARNQIKDSLHKILEQQGCVYQERHGWERPGWYSDSPVPVKQYDYYGVYDTHPKHESYPYFDRVKDDYTFDYERQYEKIKSECLSCRENAAVYNMSCFGKFYMTGPDAQKAADWIFSNKMDQKEGVTVYTCMLNQFGGTEADLTVSVLKPGEGSPCDPKFEGVGFYLAAGGGAAQQNLAHVMSVIRQEKFNVDVLDYTRDMGLLSIQGPRSRDVLQPLVDTDLSNEAFPFSTHKVVKLAGHKLRMMRISFVGEMGWELHVPMDSMVDVYNAVMKQGEPHGLSNSGFRAIDCLSVEKGYRHWHADIRLDDTPLEAGLAFTCKLKTNTDFLGRAALEKQKKEGMKKRLACFTTDVGRPLHSLEAIWRDGERVGFVRRAGHAFTLNKEIAYGYISNKGEEVTMDWMKKGKYQIEVRGELTDATFHPKTPFDPENKRVKGLYESS